MPSQNHRPWPISCALEPTTVTRLTSLTSNPSDPSDTALDTAFDLSDHLAAKADPGLIAADDEHFAAIAESLEQTIEDLSDRLDAVRRAPERDGQAALERDLETHRLST